MTKCPIVSDKYKAEFPCLPEGEFSESVIELTNKSGKNYTIEVVPPMNAMSGLTVNPLVKPIEAGKSTLVSIKYDSKFRDLTYQTHADMMAPKNDIGEVKATGLAKAGRNKRLEEKIKRQKEERENAAGAADPKAKGKAPPAKEAKKEDAKAAAGKGGKKSQAQIEEEEAEEERLRKEAAEAEKARISALEEAFDKDSILKSFGGRVIDFDRGDDQMRT